MKNRQIFARKSTARGRLDLEYLDETSSRKVSLRERADMEPQIGRKLKCFTDYASKESLGQVHAGVFLHHHIRLQTALELYDTYQFKIMECDQHAEKALAAFEAKVTVAAPDLSRLRSAEKRQEALQRHHLEEMTGADLTKLPGLDLLTVQRILSEIGLDMSWPNEKHFCAWLNVAPNNRISGGKILSSKPRKNANRAAAALRLAAQGAMQSKTATGAFIRRIKSRLGAPTAINAGPTNSPACSTACSSSARLTSKPDRKPMKVAKRRVGSVTDGERFPA